MPNLDQPHNIGWVTMSGFISQCGTFIYTVTSHPGQLSLAIPSWVGTMSTSQRAAMPHSWGVKAGLYKALYKLICLLYFTIIEDHTSSCADCPCAIFTDALLSTVDMFRRPCRALYYYRPIMHCMARLTGTQYSAR